MNSIDLVIVGAHHGFWLEKLVKETLGKIILIEPVFYNFQSLRNRFQDHNNIIYENIAIDEQNGKKNFFFVKEKSISKLGKHWASGIGSFSKEHLLNHRKKRFQIEDEDIECHSIKTVTFNALIIKYNISYIKKLIIDAEGWDHKIIKSINFEKVSINEIQFEKKHMNLEEKVGGNEVVGLLDYLSKQGYSVVQKDDENILVKKINEGS